MRNEQSPSHIPYYRNFFSAYFPLHIRLERKAETIPQFLTLKHFLSRAIVLVNRKAESKVIPTVLIGISFLSIMNVLVFTKL